MISRSTGAAIAALLAAASLPPVSAQETSYPVTIQNGFNTFTVDAAPQRAIGVNLQNIELMLALGLEDRMAGVAYIPNYDNILDPLMERVENLPILAEQNLTLEVALGVEADFIIGTNNSFVQNFADLDTLKGYGIAPMVPESDSTPTSTMEEVYRDIRNLGIVFDVQPRAEALIAEIRAEMDAITDVVGTVADPVTVLQYNGSTDSVLTPFHDALPTNIISLAGGRNIFDDMPGRMGTVNMEEIVARNPDVIIVLANTPEEGEERIAFLEGNPALSTINAVQNDHYVVMSITQLQGGVRNANAVRALAEGFYPELFEE